MRSHQIRFPDTLWGAAKEKAGLMPISAVIRKLLELWVKGKIDLNQ